MATEEQLKALPILRADARVQLVCVRWHRHLVGTQITVQTNEGEFRIPKALWPLAKKAVEALDANGAYEGPDEGVLAQVLRDVAESPADGSDEHPSGLQLLAERLADECFNRLKDLTQEAVRRRLESGRDVLFSEAARGLV